MAKRKVYPLSKVFVPGAQPDLTYNPREGHHLERRLNAYLDRSPGQALTIFGPSKSGKTVLVQRCVSQDNSVWISGRKLKTVDDLWSGIVDQLAVPTQVEVSRQRQRSLGGRMRTGLRLPLIGSADVDGRFETAATRGTRVGHTLSVESVAIQSLKARPKPVVIDDFHYASEDALQDLSRAIKSLIEFCKVILIAVPSAAFKTVSGERDMTGRVKALEITPWSTDELQFIADSGFKQLNVKDDAGLGAAMAGYSYGAPCLMQELCCKYTEDILQLKKTASDPVPVNSVPDLAPLLLQVARDGCETFDRLLAGPPSSDHERVPYVQRDGTFATDIYGTILHAVAKVGTAEVADYVIRREIGQDFDDPPSQSEVVSALAKLAEVAADHRGNSDPALAYVGDKLLIEDPYLLLYLHHGRPNVAKDLDVSAAAEPTPPLDPDEIEPPAGHADVAEHS